MNGDEDDDGYDLYETDNAYFGFADCNCAHTPEQHGWQECDVDGCGCCAYWEE